jgi:dienelactone hydrolase
MKNLLFVFTLAAPALAAADIPFTSGMAVGIRGNGRTIVIQDQLLYDRITGNPSALKMQRVEANKDGVFSGGAFNSGYAEFEIESPKEEVKYLEATGFSLVYVNGQPRAGDPYSFGYLSLPVKLSRGKNHFLFSVGRGSFRATLKDAKPLGLDLRDATLPDLVSGKKERVLAGVIVKNGTDSELSDLSIRVGSVTTKLGILQPMTNRKFPVEIKPNASGQFTLELLKGGVKVDEQSLRLRVRKQGESYKRTFISEIDGSCQYYAVQPSRNPGSEQALFLSLHGASVEAIGHADSYSPKSWGNIVCPTNRRPYGFDWEGIGRLDALEVLDLASKELKADQSKTYLTGHSMGGHGTWILGTLFPDRFAAIAPCAGWISFQSYGGGATYPETEKGKWIKEHQAMSATLSMKSNLTNRPIFTNHGDADNTVPVAEARRMREELKGHFSFQSREEPGQGHWYDTDPEPGANCVDYAPIFDLFAKTTLPKAVTEVDFTTPDPNVTNKCHWITIEQIEAGVGRIVAKSFPLLKRFDVKTTDVSQFFIATNEKDVVVMIDGEEVRAQSANGIARFVKRGRWKAGEPGPFFPTPKLFQDVFNHRVVFVYEPTEISGLENWARNKAIYDAEQLWYRGNGSVDIISKKQFESNPTAYEGRNILMYQVNPKLPTETTEFRIAQKSNRPDRLIASITVSDSKSAQLADRIPLFTSGAWIPANIRFKVKMLQNGVEEIERIDEKK